jgi:hypothetical protein
MRGKPHGAIFAASVVEMKTPRGENTARRVEILDKWPSIAAALLQVKPCCHKGAARWPVRE